MASNSSPQSSVQSLFLQHAAAVRGFVLGLVADRAAADDIVQEIFLTVVQREAEYRRNDNFLAWARGIARKKVLEHYRHRRTKPLLFDEQVLEQMAESVVSSAQQWELRREALSRCLERLAPRAREIVDLRYAEQPLTPSELAQRIGWTMNAVNVALARARSFLRECTRRALTLGEVS